MDIFSNGAGPSASSPAHSTSDQHYPTAVNSLSEASTQVAGISRASSSSTTVKRKQTRTSNACERCKTRKQKCVALTAEATAPCRNCHESMSECVFTEKLPRSGRTAKKARTVSTTPVPATARPEVETEQPRHGLQGPLAIAPAAAAISEDLPGQSSSFWSPPAPPPQSSSFTWSYPQQQAAVSSLPPPPHSLPSAPIVAPQLQSIQNIQNRVNAGSSLNSKSPFASPGTVTSADTEASIEESAAQGVAYISLEAAAESHYVGQSSGATWASLILNGMAASNSIVPKVELRSDGKLSDTKALHAPHADLRLPSSLAAFVLETVYRHIQPRYPFVDWIVLHHHWQERDKYITAATEGTVLDRDEASVAFLVLMTLAIGTQLCARAEVRLPPSEEYYSLSLQYMDSIVQLHNLPNVQALLLLAMYSLHDSKGPSVWYLSGTAIRLCIGMGLHRRASPLQERTLSKYTLEMRKRIFWTSYTLDRTMAMSLGRPPGIADSDIDVELPDDVDCVDTARGVVSGSVTSMSSSVHVIKLMRIQSRVQKLAYGVSAEKHTRESDIWGFIGLLDEWERNIPPSATTKDCWKIPCCSLEWFKNKSAETRLYLLRPSLIGPNAAMSPFLEHAAKSAASIGNAQKRLHQQGQPLSSSALYTLFLAGLTLLYTVYLKPSLLPPKEVFASVRAFSNTLFSYSQQLKTAEPLHNIFEELSLHCLERMNSRPDEKVVAQSHNGMQNPVAVQEKSAPDDWQEALFGTTKEINTATAGEFASLFESLGLPSGPSLEQSDFAALPTAGTGVGLDMDPFLLDFSWNQPVEYDWSYT